jgi:hypothetical protein
MSKKKATTSVRQIKLKTREPRHLLYVEDSEGFFRFHEGSLEELQAYKPQSGETTRLLRKP